METPEFSPKEAIKNSQFIKEFAQSENLKLSGGTPKEFTRIELDAQELLKQVQSENKEWVEEKLAPLNDYLSEIDEQVLEANFQDGFRLYLKNIYYLFRKVSPQEIAKMEDENYLREVIFTYFFNFIQTVKKMSKDNVAPNTAIEIAKKSYRFNPNDFRKYQNAFPEMETWVILHAMKVYAEPENFMQDVEIKKTELAQDFPDFEDWIIMRAVVNYPTKSKDYLRNIEKKLPELKKKYPDFSDNNIIYILAVCTTSPEKKLKDLYETLPDLREKYPEFSDALLLAIAQKHKQPEIFIEKVRETLGRLEELYPDIPQYTLLKAAVNHPKDPEKWIDNSIKETVELKNIFPNVPSWVLFASATGYSNPKAIIQKVSALKESYQNKYPEFSDNEVWRIVFNNHNDPEPVFEKSRIALQDLYSEFPQEAFPYISPSIMRHIAITYPSRAIKFLEMSIEKANSYVQNHPESSLGSILWIIVRNPINPELAIAASKNKEKN